MKKLLLGIAAACLAGFTFAQDAPLWMRHSVISPDGTTIAFTYKGDIYTVPVAGGRAMQITTNPAYDTAPVWSPDSKRIAFASDRMGSLDVYIVAKDGGEPRRLTTHSGAKRRLLLQMLDISCSLRASCRLPRLLSFPLTGSSTRSIEYQWREGARR